MPSSGMLRGAALVRTEVSEERITSIFMLKTISELRTTSVILATDTVLRGVIHLLVTANVVPSLQILFPMIMEAVYSSETSVLTRATLRHIPEYVILEPSV
jgi:hypothetical protein